MTTPTIQNSFIGGEISPSLWGRTDLQKYHSGTGTCRNFFVNYRGGASSRAGLAYSGTSKQAFGTPPRLITFQFNINQGYALEFGDNYMRIISNGEFVVEQANAITAITKASPGVFTYTNTHYSLSNGDWIFIQNVGGMTNFNNLIWIVAGLSGSNFHVTDLFGNAVDTSTFSAYTSGGTLERIYTVTSPYAAVDLPYLKFTQSEDEMSLTCVNQETGTEYPPYDLVRSAATSWAFTATDFAAKIAAPSSLAATAHNSTTKTTWYSYGVTAVDNKGNESILSAVLNVENNDIAVNAGSNALQWNSVSGADYYNIYEATPSYSVQTPIGVFYGFIGSSFSTGFTDTNIVADFSFVPPTHTDPFARSAITSVTITAQGAAYTQASVGYSISTATGSGFAGTPVVQNGAVTSFVVEDGGQGYAPADTITITGGGAAVSATGTYTFNNGQPSNLQTIILAGVTWTFVSGSPVGNQTQISSGPGSSLAATLNQLSADLNASANASISLATYTNSSTVLTITYAIPGTGGNSYTLAAGTYNGVVSGAHLTGGTNTGGATASLVLGSATGTYPSVVAYFQQRRYYANTTNKPNTYYASQPGNFTNMDTSIPVQDSDAIVGSPWAQQINGIQFMIPMTAGLVILTGNGAWNLTGGTNAAVTPSDQTATAQAYNGCHDHIAPIVVNYDILYVQAKGSIIRDLSYNFFVNIYTGTDMTVLSNHLFNYHQLVQWAYAEEPYKLIWVVRDDGILLCLTYLKEQDVYAWSRHDTNGFFVSVCSVTEPPVDAVYVMVQRFVQGQWRYYIERMDNRNWINAEDCFCVDSGLQYPASFPAATLTPAAAEGTSNITSTKVVYGGSNYTSPTAQAIDESGNGTGATFSVTVAGGVITAVTPVLTGENYVMGATTIEIDDTTGSGAVIQPIITDIVDFTTDSGVFSAGDVGSVIRIGNNDSAAVSPSSGVTNNGGGQATITSYISSTHVQANITQAITAVVPNDPNFTPVPAISGQWSVSVPTMTVGGLNHLEGLEVAILADGSVAEKQIVTNGSVTLQNAASKIAVGLPYTCQLQTLNLDPPGLNTVQGRRKSVFNTTIRCETTRGIQVGSNQPNQSAQPNNANVPWTDLVEVKQRNATIPAGQAIPLFTGDFYKNIISNWNTVGSVAIQQDYPLSANILCIISDYILGDTKDAKP